MAKKQTTKVATVIALAQRKSGCTLAEISTKLRISKSAASSLVADARRKGAKIKYDEGRYRL